MPVAKKPASPARVAANRANARKSTGPRTAEGKARSRANAAKHGLTGAGIALPGEDAAAVEGRFLQIQEELAPATVLGAELAHQLAVLSVRRRRAARAEAAHLRTRVRRAAVDFDRARATQADQLLDAIGSQPRACRRLLLEMPEGVDRLIRALLELRLDLTGPAPTWTAEHHRRLDALFGFRPDDLPRNRPTRFSRTLTGDLDALGPADGAPEADPELTDWVAERVVATIDAEVEALRAHRATLDHAAIAEDRLDAADRALADPGRDAELTRRYAAAAGREFSQTLRNFHLVEAMIPAEPEPEPEPEPTLATEPPAPAPAPATGPPAVDPKPCSANEMGSDLASFGAPVAAAPAVAPAPPLAAATGPIRAVHTAEPVSFSPRVCP